MIKVGDTVKRVRGSFKGMEVGDTDVVVCSVKYGVWTTVMLKNFEGEHSWNNLELVKPMSWENV